MTCLRRILEKSCLYPGRTLPLFLSASAAARDRFVICGPRSKTGRSIRQGEAHGKAAWKSGMEKRPPYEPYALIWFAGQVGLQTANSHSHRIQNESVGVYQKALTLPLFLCQNAFTYAFFLIFIKSILQNCRFFYGHSRENPARTLKSGTVLLTAHRRLPLQRDRPRTTSSSSMS